MWGMFLDSPRLDVWDCFGSFEAKIYGTGTKCGDYFQIVRNRNFETALGSLGTNFLTNIGP